MEIDSPETPPPPKPSTTTFTPAQRIAELNEIDQSISTLLSAASDAISILSNSPSSEAQEQALRNPSLARSAFTDAASTYFSTLSSIEVRLRRQVYALEEAKLIKPGDENDARKGRKFGGDTGTTRVGGGPLDPSWLNARASDKVETEMKRELLAQAKTFVEQSERNADKGQTKAAESVQAEEGAIDPDSKMS